ncbi:MAG: hypothetical protein AAB214_20280 [Fibrobacterota bacterium]
MSTDPIKLVQNILNPKIATPASTSKSAETAQPSTSGDSATTTAKANESTANKAASNASEAYKLSQSLQKKLTQANTGATPETPDLSTYTAQGIKDYFQSAHEAQTKAKAAATAAPKPLDDVLKVSQGNATNEPKLSAAAQEIVKEKKTTATDTALAAVDSRLAQTVGISRTIGTV